LGSWSGILKLSQTEFVVSGFLCGSVGTRKNFLSNKLTVILWSFIWYNLTFPLFSTLTGLDSLTIGGYYAVRS